MSTAFQGTYTADLFNPSKRYRIGTGYGVGATGGFQKGVALADSELREIQMVSDSFVRQLIHSNYARGSSTNDGFKVIQSTSTTTNNFEVTGGDGTVNGAGILFVDGFILFLKSNIQYNEQDDTGALTDDDYTKTSISALTTPSGNRTDEVYVDFYFAEVSNDAGSEYEDSSLAVSGIGSTTANRIRQVQDILVAEGGSTPADTTDGNGIAHKYVKIAELARLDADATITTAMITDSRTLMNSSFASFTEDQVLVGAADGSIDQSVNFVFNGTNVGIGTASPQAMLHVNGDIVGRDDDTSDLGSATRRWANIYMASTINHASGMNITGSGGVGIGTVPGGSNSLEVGGSALIHTDLTVNGTTTIVNTETTVTDKMKIDQDDAQTALEVNKTNASTGTAVTIVNAGTSPALTISGTTINVGIGTASPQETLHVMGNIAGSSADTSDLGSTVRRFANLYMASTVDYGTTLNFDENGTTEMTILTGGNVGIGTSNPLKTLHVKSPDGSGNQLALGNVNGTIVAALSAEGTLANQGFLNLGHGNTSNLRLSGSNSGESNYIMSGNVGIGTSNPQQLLHLRDTAQINVLIKTDSTNAALTSYSNSNTSTQIGQENASGGNIATGSTANSAVFSIVSANSMHFGTSGTVRMTILPNGNVGIGTAAPENELIVWKDQNDITNITISNHTVGTASAASITMQASNTLSVGANFTIRKHSSAHTGTTDAGNSLAKATFFGAAADSSTIIFNPSSASIIFEADVLETMRILPNGNVGIGITNPTSGLEVTNSGIVAGSPTGGDKGTGTLNATGVYDDNVLLTDYVFEKFVGGKIDFEDLDKAISDETHERTHTPSREFDEKADLMFDLDKYAEFFKENLHLPSLPEFKDWVKDKLSDGAMIQKFWEIIEVQAIHIHKLNERLKALEAKVA